ncbi:hypothetical protein PTMSG1_03170 [Pyrenophora teres f. maculata]|nr:hypothetical protein PTMSG1_03170 [Pyrenophora teres f. maculata]
MDMEPGFVVTAWRNRQELLQLRQDLYNTSDKICRQKAVNKVFAWRLRKPEGLPLLLDSTADIVDVVLQDERAGLAHNALRLLYATAISRFVTGLADTQIELTRDRPSWFLPGKALQLPLALLETRHRIVHRHLPSLAELKRAAAESLSWLWEWYWSQLETAFTVSSANVNANGEVAGENKKENEHEEIGVETAQVLKEKLQSLLKTYLKDRKTEIKNNRGNHGSNAVSKAVSSYTTSFNIVNTGSPPQITQLVLNTLLDPKIMLPTDRKLGTSMSGAFLIWTPLLLAFCTGLDTTTTSTTPATIPLSTLLSHMLRAMNTPSTRSPEADPVREGWHDWVLHVLTSPEWETARWAVGGGVVDEVLMSCFSKPTLWNLRVAEGVLGSEGLGRNKEQWTILLDAARGVEGGDGDMDVDVDVEEIEEAVVVGEAVVEGDRGEVGEKISGPVKVLGMWKGRPLGWVPEGWEDDE